MHKRSNSVSIVCTDCKTGFILDINSVRELVVCPKCKQSDPLSFGTSIVAGHKVNFADGDFLANAPQRFNHNIVIERN